jgi:hypothetical protein
MDTTGAITIRDEHIPIRGKRQVGWMIKRGAWLITLPQTPLAPARPVEHNDFVGITVNDPNAAIRPACQHVPVDNFGAPGGLAGPVRFKNHNGRARRVHL